MPTTRAVAATMLLLLAACSTVEEDLTRAYLVPPTQWLVEPAHFGLRADEFELPAEGGTLHGWFVHGKEAQGRTVVLFHDRLTNVSMVHPWYSFLVEGGFHVCVYDWRGYGRSRGAPSLHSVFDDVPVVLEWLRRRDDVDARKIAYYGIALGSVVALRAAARQQPCAALVLENVPSARAAVREILDARGAKDVAADDALAVEQNLPRGCEPSLNSAQLTAPSLWIAGAEEPPAALAATLAAYGPMGGDKQLWLLPQTGNAPHSLLTHDGAYQQAVLRFLRSALAGAPERVAAQWRPIDDSAQGRWQLDLTAFGGTPQQQEPWALQLAAIAQDGQITWSRTQLDAPRKVLQLELPSAPVAVSATRLLDVEFRTDGSFDRLQTPLARGGAWYEARKPDFDRILRGQASVAQARAAAAAIREREQQERTPPLLDAQMAGVYAQIGLRLATAKDAEDRAAAIVWLRRAHAAAPKDPAGHYWPGRTLQAGFADAAVVAEARALLRTLVGG